MQFWNFLVVRLLQAVVVIFIVVSLVFLVSRLVGNPEQFLAGPDATEEDLVEIEERFGLNDPLIVQYGNFLADLLRGDFGHSWMGGGASAIASIGERAWNTFKLGIAALAFAIVTAVPAGRGRRPAPRRPGRLAGAGAGRRRAGGARLLAGPDDDLLLRRAARPAAHWRRGGVAVADPAGDLAGHAGDGRDQCA